MEDRVGLSTSVLASVPGAVLLVTITEFLGSEHQRTNNCRENPDSISVVLAKTHYIK